MLEASLVFHKLGLEYYDRADEKASSVLHRLEKDSV